MKGNRKTLINSDTGAADLTSPNKRHTSTLVEPMSADQVSTRHKVSFMDEVTGDKK